MFDDGRAVLLRAWDSGARVGAEGRPIWLVQVRVLEPVTRLGIFNTWREIDGSAEIALAALRGVDRDWRWRQPGDSSPWLVWDPAHAEVGGVRPEAR